MSRKKITITLLTLLGLLLLGFIVSRIGFGDIWASLRRITLGQFLILIALRIAYWILRTLGWQVIFQTSSRAYGFWALFTARMTGHAISQLTPTSQIGSEATRTLMVSGAGHKHSVSSVIIDKSIELLTASGFTLLALTFVLTQLHLPRAIQLGLLIPTLIFFALVLYLLLRQKKGLLMGLVNLAARLRIRPAFVDRHRERIEETDRLISDFYRHHPRRFLLVVALYTLMLSLWVAEIHLNMLFLELQSVKLMESTLVTLSGNITFLLSVIPGSLGVYEATYIGVLSLFKRPAEVAFSLVLMRRILAMLLSVFGLLAFVKPLRTPRMAPVNEEQLLILRDELLTDDDPAHEETGSVSPDS